jgi:hypothetical protein
MADTINTLSSASDYAYVTAENRVYLGNKSLSCSCVAFGKDYIGITRTLGVAKYIKPTTQTATLYSMVLTSEGPLGHLGIILDIDGDEMWIIEANYKPCQVTYRTLKIDDPAIRGYLIP